MSVTQSARTISLAVLGSRVLGLVREQVLAALFGAGKEFDAFITAFRIPNLLRDLFAEGALSAAFVPTLSKKITTDGDPAAWRLANLVLNALVIVLSLITLIGILAAPWIVRALAPGFGQIEGKLELTVLLTRIMFPFLLMIAVAALAMGMLNAKHRFGIPASASMMFNIGSILGGLGFVWWLAPGFFQDRMLADRAMIGMSIGTLIGGAAQLLIQVPSLFHAGYRYAPVLDWRDSGFREVMRLVGPAVLGVAAVQINVFVNNWFASWPTMSGENGSGAVTWLNCAFRLMQFPIGMFGVALGVATLPTVSAHAARGETDAFRSTLARSIRLAFFLCIPSAMGLAVLADPIISVIYEHGRFDVIARENTAWCLRAYAVGLAGYAAIKVLAPAFYALGDSRTPMFVSLGSILVNIVLNYMFAIALGLGASGLALSTSCVALTNFFLLMIFMRRKIQRIETTALLASLVKITVAAALMGAAAYGTHTLIEVNRFANVAISIVIALTVFAVSCKALCVTEFKDLLSIFRRRGHV